MTTASSIEEVNEIFFCVMLTASKLGLFYGASDMLVQTFDRTGIVLLGNEFTDSVATYRDHVEAARMLDLADQ